MKKRTPFEKLQHNFSSLGASALRKIKPEQAHHLAGFFLKNNLMPFQAKTSRFSNEFDLSCELLPGTKLEHPIGLAAGFDKNAEFLPGLSKLGFSFIEVGAATPLSQSGNPKPRIFRQKNKLALINRMGFNNDGISLINKRIENFLQNNPHSPPLGLNIGVNKKTPVESALNDYLKVLQASKSPLSYFSINLSSPNTESLKHLCHPDLVKRLASQIKAETDKPLNKIWIKLGPNLEKDFFQSLVEAVSESGFRGLILTNTYPVSQPETGGLSGPPIFEEATKRLEWAWEVHKGKLPMVGSGGVSSGKNVLQKIARGADLVQIYTSFIYRGPLVCELLLEEVTYLMRKKGIKSLREIRGSFYEEKKIWQTL